MKQKGLSLAIKRLFDISFGLILLVCSSPFFGIAALVVKCASPESPILFKQERIGYRNKKMVLYKLRSMTNEKDQNGNLLPDKDRLKPWGSILRRTNLDEIPQIWNVMKGQMSLIGPRPLLAQEMEVMTEVEQMQRQSVLPGITGWEAINESKSGGRREMAEYDLFYVNKWSLSLDLKILFDTAFIVFLNRRPPDNLRAPRLDEEMVEKSTNEERQVTK